MAEQLTFSSLTNTYKTTLGTDEVVIGGKSASFEPVICFTKWAKENSLTISAKDLISSTTPTLTGNKIELKDSKIGWYANPVDENMKFGVILYEKPLTNSWSFQLEGWEEYDFWYQPFLKNIEADGSSWQGYAPDSPLPHNAKCFRPAGIGGGYCIYHKDKRNHIIGQTNYGNGKCWDILRAKFIDAKGDWTWGTIEIKDGLLTETCPWDFLNSATYPVRSNTSTWGVAGIGASSAWMTSNTTPYFRLNANSPAGSNTLNYLSFGLTPAVVHETTIFGFYSESSSKPSTRLVYDAVDWDLVTTTKGFYTNPVDMNYSLTAATRYWGAFYSNVDYGMNIWYDTSPATQAYMEINYTSKMPATTTGLTDSTDYDQNATWSIYATYTAGGGGITVTPSPLALTASLPTATYKFDFTHTLATLDLTVTLLAPSAYANVTYTPAVLALTATLPTPTIKYDFTHIVSTLNLAATLKDPAVNYTCTYTPDLLTLTVSLLDPTVDITGGVVNQTVLIDALNLVLELLAPAINFDYVVSLSSLDLTASVLSPDVNLDYLYAVSALNLVATLLDPTTEAGQGITVSLDTLDLTSGLLDPTINFDYLVSLLPLNLTAVLKDPTVNFDFAVDVTALALTAGLLDPTITTSTGRCYFVYNSANTSIDFYVGGGLMARINSTGNFDVKGIMTTGVTF